MRMHILDAMQRRGTLEASSGKAVSNRHRQQSSDAMSHDGSSNSTTSDAGATAFADDTEREAMVKTIQNEMRRSRASDSQVLQCLRSLKSVCDEGLRALANGQAACISLRDGRMYNDIHPVQGSESFLYRAGWCVRVAQFERQWVHEGRTALLRTAQHVLQKTLDEMHMHNESEEARKRREQQRERERRCVPSVHVAARFGLLALALLHCAPFPGADIATNAVYFMSNLHILSFVS